MNSSTNLQLSLATRAKIELEKRRRKKEKEQKLGVVQPFNEWLKETSPEYEWDYQHLLLIQKHLQEIVDGKQKRIIILMPPQHGKSLHTTIHFPAYFLEKFPEKRIIVGAYNREYACKFSMASKRLLQRRNFVFGDMNHANEWNTGRGGFLKSFGFQSGITGTSSDLTIIDDPIKNITDARSIVMRDKVWDEFEYSIESREQKNTSFIIILTRWHHDDLVGRLLKRDGREAWDIISLPAIAEENDLIGRAPGEPLCEDRKTLEKLLKERHDNPAKFAALFQQNPSIDGGNIIKEEYFQDQYYDTLPRLDYVVESIDTNQKPSTNKKGSYTAITTWGVRDDKIFMLDCWRGKCGYLELKEMALRKNDQYSPSYLLIEDTVNGCALIQELTSTTMLPIKPIDPHGDKQIRLEACTPLFANKKIFFPKNASWLYDYIQEMISFPTGTNNDQVDSTSQALNFIQNRFQNYYSSLCN